MGRPHVRASTWWPRPTAPSAASRATSGSRWSFGWTAKSNSTTTARAASCPLSCGVWRRNRPGSSGERAGAVWGGAPAVPLLAPICRLAIPAMGAQLSDQVGRQRAGRAGGDVGLNVVYLAHTRDDRAHVRVRQNEAQCHLGHRRAVGHERPDRVHTSNRGGQVLRHKVCGAPITLRPGCVEGEVADETALVEGNASDNGHVVLTAGREQLVLGRLVEDVVDDLHGIDKAGSNRLDAVPGLPAVEANSKGPNGAFSLQLCHRPLQLAAIEPVVLPDVQLKEVDRVNAQVRAADVHLSLIHI